MQINLLSVNIANPEPINTRRGMSGIFKRPQPGRVGINKTGLANDAILDLQNHGGIDQAVYLYTQPDYDWWSADLSKPCEPGLFGENLTVSGLESASVKVGDRYRIGSVLLEVTSPFPAIRLPAERAMRTGSNVTMPEADQEFIAASWKQGSLRRETPLTSSATLANQ
jgi:MOSC domain-containing protein YiiM